MSSQNSDVIKDPSRKTELLRKGRRSIPNAKYFLTLTTKGRKQDLTQPALIEVILTTWREMHQAKDIELHCGTIMPDHIHLLITLGKRITLSQTISKFKSLTKPALSALKIEWQSNYFDHWLRPDTQKEPFIRYIFLNPYRKGLLNTDQTWPSWVLNRNENTELRENLHEGKYPQPEWLTNSTNIMELIEPHRYPAQSKDQ